MSWAVIKRNIEENEEMGTIKKNIPEQEAKRIAREKNKKTDPFIYCPVEYDD